jgi:hypothetical protein
MTRSIALPAAAATAVTASVDFGTRGAGPLGDRLEVHVVTPALPDLVDAKTVTYSIEESDDDSSFTSLMTLDAATVTGADSAGAAAGDFRFYLPPETKQYVRLSATVLASGGDNTGVATSLQFRV